MKTLTFLTLAVIFGLFSCQVNGQNVEVIEPTEFQKLINDNMNPQLIDVRTPDEYNMGHLDGAENINFRDSNFKTQLQKLDKTRPVYVYCAVGGRSGKSAEILNEMGFSKIYDLSGGYNAWSAAGKETVRE